MNYFAHGYRFVDDAYFLAGTALPDWLSAADREVRVPPIRVRKWVDATDPRVATVARGILQHHDDDAEFHVTQAFADLNVRFAKAIKRLGTHSNDMGVSLLAHIVPELMLDAILIEEQPGLLDRYYEAVYSIDSASLQEIVECISGRPAKSLPRFLEIFQHEQFLRDYADDDRLCYRLGQVLRRVGWGTLPEGFEQLVPEMRRDVSQRREEMLRFLLEQ